MAKTPSSLRTRTSPVTVSAWISAKCAPNAWRAYGDFCFADCVVSADAERPSGGKRTVVA